MDWRTKLFRTVHARLDSIESELRKLQIAAVRTRETRPKNPNRVAAGKAAHARRTEALKRQTEAEQNELLGMANGPIVDASKG